MRRPDERARGAELNRIMRGETKPGIYKSWRSGWPLLLSFMLGLVFWGVIGWLIWRAR